MRIYDYNGSKVYVKLSAYNFDGSVAIQLYDAVDDAPYATLTVCLQDDLGLPYFCAGKSANFVDVNNNPGAEEFIAKYGLGKPAGRTARSGWCEYPLYEFDLKKLAE